ncbi:MAG: PKD domain-containing protein, partial [Bacteroidota bacterium]
MMRNYTSYFRIGERFLLTLLFFGLFSFAQLSAEGVKQLAPTAGDGPVMLETNRPEFGNFAAPDGPQNGRLYVSVANPNETIYIGLSAEYRSTGLPYTGNILWSRYLFRIRRDDGLGSGNPIVHPADPNRDYFTIGEDNANLSNWDEAEFGLYDTTTTQFGERIYAFTPGQAGDYYIEFKEFFSSDEEDWVSIPFWDFTVGENGEERPGRVWSRNWSLRTPNVNDGVLDPCIWNKPFNGQLFSYTDDGFVSKIDFAQSGMQGLSFTLAFNSSGPGNTGDLGLDRQSVPDQNATLTSAQHKIFLLEPDITLFPDGLCGEITPSSTFVCTGDGEYCLDVEVTKAGQVEVILDFNRNGQLDDNSLDLSLIYEFSENDLLACIPWDGLRGDGSPISFNDTIDLIFLYSQGVQHWSAYDLEFMKNGYCIETIRPACSASMGQSTNLYWDDRLIPEDPGNGSEKDGRDGCPCESGCRTWDNFDIGAPSCEAWMSDTTTSGYGDKTTLNTWWFANSRTVSIVDIPLVTIDIAGPDSICLGSTAVFTAVNVDATGEVTYSWSGPGVQNETGTSLTVSQGGEYCLTIFDELNCGTTTCKTLIAVDNSNDVVDYPAQVGACLGEEITLIPAGVITGNSTYSWFPETGLNDPTSATPSFTLTGPQTYVVTIGAGDFVCTFTDTVEVVPFVESNAAFDFAFGCNRQEYSFNSTSTNADSLFWDFGDPSTNADFSNALDPVYLYPGTGLYTVQLWAYSADGCVDSTSVDISVTDDPAIELSLDVNGVQVVPSSNVGTPSNPIIVCDPTATILPTANIPVVFSYLDAADELLGTGTSYALPASGVYTITVLANSDEGCSRELTVTISYGPVTLAVDEPEISCNSLELNFSSTLTGVDSIHWDFGDPAITTDVSAEEDPVYVYGQPGTYTVQLSVFSDEGCSESTSFP